MGRGGDLWLSYVELLGISGNLISDIWNTPCPKFNPPRIRFNSMRVRSPPIQNHWESWWESGGDLLLGHLELLEINWDMNFNSWNTHFHTFKMLRMRFKCLGVCSPPMQTQWEHRCWIGADVLVCCLESLGFSSKLIRNDWNTCFLNFNPMQKRINNLGVYSPPKQIPLEWRWVLGWIRWCAIGNCLKSVWT